MVEKNWKDAILAFPLLLLSKVLIGQREKLFCLQINAMNFSDKCHHTVNYQSQTEHGHERKVKTSREHERHVSTPLFLCFYVLGNGKKAEAERLG